MFRYRCPLTVAIGIASALGCSGERSEPVESTSSPGQGGTPELARSAVGSATTNGSMSTGGQTAAATTHLRGSSSSMGGSSNRDGTSTATTPGGRSAGSRTVANGGRLSSAGGATIVVGSISASDTGSSGGAKATTLDDSTASGGAGSRGGTTSNGSSVSTGGSTSTAIDSDAIYVSPTGTASAAGTLSEPTNLATAITRVTAGKTIYLRGGTYAFGSTITLSKSGSRGAPYELKAYPLDTARPKFDFSAMSESDGNRGMVLSASYWHIYGLDFYHAGDNCMNISGSNNIVEFSTFSECSDTGLQLGGGAADNLILNCDSFYNADSKLENADGFAAKLDVGSGNQFVGCRAWNNLDDGWDGYLRGADDVTTSYENCWAIDNGKLKDGSVSGGDGNGFKTGGSDDKALKHNATYTRCIAAGNTADGFDHNSNRGSVTLLNCAAHDNASNINFSTSNIAAALTIKNTSSVGSLGGLSATRTDITNNSWQNGLSATNADYESIDTALLKSARKGDGSLPDIDYFKLVSTSDLRNAGRDVGLPYSGSAPEIGPFEYAE